MASDIERIRQTVSLPDLVAGYGVRLKLNGTEHEACCPLHAEDTPSFTIFTGKDRVERFHCFGCGEKGDVIDFVIAIKGLPKDATKQAIAIIDGTVERPNITPRNVEVRDIYEGIEPLDPVGTIEPRKRVTIYNPKRAGTDREWGSFAPSMAFLYRRLNGSPIGYVLRHELPDGGKETPMVMWARLASGKECWCRLPFPKPRPLYGLEVLEADTRQVIVVEGEKKVDALRRATGRAVVAWVGGTQGARHCDWSPLAGRNVVMWRDADPEGLKVQDEIGGILSAFEGTTFRVLDIEARPA